MSRTEVPTSCLGDSPIRATRGAAARPRRRVRGSPPAGVPRWTGYAPQPIAGGGPMTRTATRSGAGLKSSVTLGHGDAVDVEIPSVKPTSHRPANHRQRAPSWSVAGSQQPLEPIRGSRSPNGPENRSCHGRDAQLRRHRRRASPSPGSGSRTGHSRPLVLSRHLDHAGGQRRTSASSLSAITRLVVDPVAARRAKHPRCRSQRHCRTLSLPEVPSQGLGNRAARCCSSCISIISSSAVRANAPVGNPTVSAARTPELILAFHVDCLQ
jgi:hypothetical protein